MLSVTDTAVQRLQDILTRKFQDSGIGFRVFELNDTTVTIKLDRIQPDDQVVEAHSIKLFLDPIIMAKLSNYELDCSSTAIADFILISADSTEQEFENRPGN